ncbi:MAG: hypothetical protein KF812_06250 [Fimbriimonadaceae bacterium]|nr:hypothetical protein [Fimbriimonadaceae bacterium]
MNSLLGTFLIIATGFVGLAFLLALFCAVRGPRLAERVVALDLGSVLLTALIVLLALYHDQLVYLDVALVVGLVGFVATVAYARYAEKGGRP